MWDDGKSGVRRLVQCRHCGSFFMVQAYRLNKFSKFGGIKYEDWYRVKNETESDKINKAYTGLQWELKNKPVLRCIGDLVLKDK